MRTSATLKYDMGGSVVEIDGSSIRSKLSIFEQYSCPDSVAWSHCSNCTMEAFGNISIHLEHSKLQSATLSWSQWNEFFYFHGNDKFYGVKFGKVDITRKVYVVKSPVYIIPMIAIHPGHVLIDLLENLYHDMMEHYGQIRNDAIIIMDVATVLQRDFLKEILDSYVNNVERLEYVSTLVKMFTNRNVYDWTIFASILKLDIPILFEQLHIGLNMAFSHYYYGYRFHPFNFQDSTKIGQSILHDIYQNYSQHFSHLIRESVKREYAIYSANSYDHDTNHSVDVVIVVKSKNRAIINIDEVLDTLSSYSLTWKLLDIGELKFYDQFPLFEDVKIFLCVAGTAIHNAQFMNPNNSIVIVIMQPFWCEYSWMYTNQLQLLGIKYYVMCSSPLSKILGSPTLGRSYGFHRQSWRQGSRMSKLLDIYVNPLELSEIIAHLDVPFISSRRAWILQDEHSKQNSRDKIHLILSSIGFEIVSTSNHQLSTFFDIAGDEVYVSNVLHSLPYLSLCSRFPSLQDSETLCVAIERMNYYASLQFQLSAEVPFVMGHFWLQISPSGGKVFGSDTYLPLETRWHTINNQVKGDETWTGMHTWFAGRSLYMRFLVVEYKSDTLTNFDNNIRDCCDLDVKLQSGPMLRPVFQDTFSHVEQYREYIDYFQFIDRLSILRSETVVFNVTPETGYELHSLIPNFCNINNIRLNNCVSLARRIYRYGFQRMLGYEEMLPVVQDMPSPQNPFVFLHIEKTGGTTLRE